MDVTIIQISQAKANLIVVFFMLILIGIAIVSMHYRNKYEKLKEAANEYLDWEEETKRRLP